MPIFNVGYYFLEKDKRIDSILCSIRFSLKIENTSSEERNKAIIHDLPKQVGGFDITFYDGDIGCVVTETKLLTGSIVFENKSQRDSFLHNKPQLFLDFAEQTQTYWFKQGFLFTANKILPQRAKKISKKI